LFSQQPADCQQAQSVVVNQFADLSNAVDFLL